VIKQRSHGISPQKVESLNRVLLAMLTTENILKTKPKLTTEDAVTLPAINVDHGAGCYTIDKIVSQQNHTEARKRAREKRLAEKSKSEAMRGKKKVHSVEWFGSEQFRLGADRMEAAIAGGTHSADSVELRDGLSQALIPEPDRDGGYTYTLFSHQCAPPMADPSDGYQETSQ
jgi:hypothetical protein